jgi:hypothetical protein
MPYQIELREGTAANWTTANPVLGAGEPGYETDTGRIKVGDGTTIWNNLKYKTVGNMDNNGSVGQALLKSATGAAWTSLQISSFVNVIVDTPEAHGAKRDGVILLDVAMTSGSGIVNSPSAHFTPADVGKSWIGTVVGPGGAGKILISTIQSYQSPTRVTLANAATNTISGVIAVYGTDDTAAIKAATNNVVALGQANNSYYGEVWFSSGIYVAAGAPDNSQHGYSQIPIPYQPPDGMKFTLIYKGTSDNSGLTHWSQPEPQMTGAVIVSAIYPAYSGTFGIPSCIGGPTGEQGYGLANNGTFSNMLFVVDGLTITLPFDHTQHGINAYAIAECNVPNMASFALGTVNGGYWWPNFVQTQGFYYSGRVPACGLVMPNVGNNDNCNIGLYSAEGLTGGIALGEHTHADSIRVISSNIAVTFTTGTDGFPNNDHSMDINYLSTEACRIHIHVPAVGSFPQILNINNWDPEDGFGTTSAYHIFDGDPGALRGEINMNTVMCPKPLIIHGGAHITDTSKHTGFLDTPPAVPAASTGYKNEFWRDAFVDVTGGTGVSVTVDGVPWSASKTIPVPSGKTINLGAYTVAPTWHWLLI